MSFLDQVKSIAENKTSFTLQDKEKYEKIACEAIADVFFEEIKAQILEKVKATTDRKIIGEFHLQKFSLTLKNDVCVWFDSWGSFKIRIPHPVPLENQEQLAVLDAEYDSGKIVIKLNFRPNFVESGKMIFKKYTLQANSPTKIIFQTLKAKAEKDKISVELLAPYEKYIDTDSDGDYRYDKKIFISDGFSYTNKKDHVGDYFIKYSFQY